MEATILVEGTDAKIIKCTANKAFTVGNSHIAEGETFFLVASERREHRYYVVHFDSTQNRPQCSCGANHKEHSHIDAYRSNIPAYAKAAKSDEQSSNQVVTTDHTQESSTEQFDGSRPLTKEEWKAIAKADKARQKAWADEYRQQAESLRAKEVSIA